MLSDPSLNLIAGCFAFGFFFIVIGLAGLRATRSPS